MLMDPAALLPAILFTAVLGWLCACASGLTVWWALKMALVRSIRGSGGLREHSAESTNTPGSQRRVETHRLRSTPPSTRYRLWTVYAVCETGYRGREFCWEGGPDFIAKINLWLVSNLCHLIWAALLVTSKLTAVGSCTSMYPWF